MSNKPTISEIAQHTPYILSELSGSIRYSGVVPFHKDEIDINGDGTLWAVAEFEVAYDWVHEPGGYDTPQSSDFDIVGVNIKDSDFFTDDGEYVKIPSDQAKKLLFNYFWDNNLQNDDILAEKIHANAETKHSEYTSERTINRI